MDIIKKLAEELNIGRHQAEAAVKLIDEGNTIPFIARYRKEATGSLNDEVLRNLDERLKYLRNLEDRKSQVIASIAEQEKLTPELELKIKEAQTLVAVEDLYRPYKPKRRTRAMIAKEKGLEPLADLISMQMTAEPVEKAAAGFVSEEKGVASVQEAIQGARDILAERISDNAAFRTYIRNITMNKGVIQSSAKDEKAQSVYEMYYNYEEPVKKAAGHRILALNRGENEKMLTVKILAPEEQILGYLEKQTIVRDNPYTTPILKEAAADSYSRLIGFHRAGDQKRFDGKSRGRRHQGIWKEPGTASDAASYRGTGGFGLGSGFPYRLQAGGGGQHGKGAGYGGHLPHSASEQGGGIQENTEGFH